MKIRPRSIGRRLRLAIKRVRTRPLILAVILLLVSGSVLIVYEVSNRPSTINSSTIAGSGASRSSEKSSSSAFVAPSGPGTAVYTVDSPATSQWLVVQATHPVLSVSASDTGAIPAFTSLASLNQTTIGNQCTQPRGNGACQSYKSVQQTGWFWDASTHTLTVHYLGGNNVTLTVVEGP